MKLPGRQVMVCNCERTMPLDADRLAALLGAEAPQMHHHLCRSQLKQYEAALAEGGPLLVACTQEAPLFAEVAEAAGREDVRFCNIRERAGWSAAGDVHAKVAALLADAMLESRPARLREVESDGSVLIHGAGQATLDAALALAPHLSVTCLLSAADDVLLPGEMPVPVYGGRLRRLTGAFGGFTASVDGYASLLPSSRAAPVFGMPRDGVHIETALVLDLSAGAPPVTGPDKRDGYHRADPANPAQVTRALMALIGAVGTFEKPIYVDYDPAICAHGRSRIVGCNKCVDICPAGAVTSAGDTVAFDALICGGCGGCASVCPTGAAASTTPYRGDLIRRIHTLAETYLQAGGTRPVLLLHDAHGAALIDAAARLGRGLPGHVIPLGLHSATVAGHDTFASAIAAGFERVVVLLDPRKADEHAGIDAEIALIEAFPGGAGRLSKLVEGDPDMVEAALWELPPRPGLAPSSFAAVGTKRDMARQALMKLTDRPVVLPAGAPYGGLKVDVEACTLCMACVSACPADALLDNPERPQLRFIEAACVQCGLCRNTCPETAIALDPRFDPAAPMQPIVVKEEAPFECIRCGKPFASPSTIRRITERLAGKHWMFETDARVQLIQMCDDCRLQAQAEMSAADNPFAAHPRPRIRTTDDYLEADKEGLTVEDFLKKD